MHQLLLILVLGASIAAADMDWSNPSRWYKGFGYNEGGWRVQNHPRIMADVNGDGRDDVVGFANAGVYVALSTGTSFGPASRWYKGFGHTEGGWRVQNHPRMVVDVNGDGKADVVGFANAGVYVALSTGSSFASASRWYKGFGYTEGGWRVQNHPRMMVDVNGDGRADVVGFANAGVYVALSTGTSFASASRWYKGFGYNEGGWRVQNHPRMVVDVNGDGKADVVGFANAGVYVALSTGTSFASASRWYKGFGYNEGGWRVQNHPRMVVDVDGDGKADVVGFANAGVYVALSTGTSFASATLEIEAFGYTQGGWRVENHPRMVADVNGDGKADIVGFANAGVYVSVGEEVKACPPRVRKAWSTLSCRERGLYISAVKKLQSTERTWYNDMVQTHATAWNYAHSSSAFLPWHRMYLLGYENALRSLGGAHRCVTIPYWDWEVDAGNEGQSSVLHANTFGTPSGLTNGCVTEGVASGWTVSSGACLRRTFNSGVGFTGEAEIVALIRNNREYRTFRRALERSPHASPHIYIGGQMASQISPADPLFFVHHCNVDRIWALWQDYWGYDAASTTTSTHYFPAVDRGQVSMNVVQLTSTMPIPVTQGGTPAKFFKTPVTINSMMKITSMPATEGSAVNSYTYGPDAMADIFVNPSTGGWNFVSRGALQPTGTCSATALVAKAAASAVKKLARRLVKAVKFSNTKVETAFKKMAVSAQPTQGQLTALARYECENVATKPGATTEWLNANLIPAAEHKFYEPCGSLLPQEPAVLPRNVL